jgi:branched-subunit amino acid transport protein AzlD
MTDRIAIFLFLVIATFFAADLLVFHWGVSLILARKFIALTQWLAFWR